MLFGEVRGLLRSRLLLPMHESDILFLSFSVALRLPLWFVRTVAASRVNLIVLSPGIRLLMRRSDPSVWGKSWCHGLLIG